MTDPTRRQIMQMADKAGIADYNAAARLVRLALAAFRPAPVPVPVSERLPGPEDCATNPCNGQGQWCWGWVQHDQPFYSGRWRMMRREWLFDEAVAWLPATALPLPTTEPQP